jgi:hypothetical protein
MTRRQAALLVGAAVRAWSGARKNIDQLVGDIPGAALLFDIRTCALLAVHRADLAGALLVPPGSAIKPFTIEALLRGGKLKDGETLLCPGALTIGGRSFNCSHPAGATPIDVRTALAYSCNSSWLISPSDSLTPNWPHTWFAADSLRAADCSATAKLRVASSAPPLARRSNCRPSARAVCS